MTASGLVLWMHTSRRPRCWIAGLSGLRKPLLHLHTQFNRALPWAEIDMDYMNTHPVRPRRPGVRVHADARGLRRKTVVGTGATRSRSSGSDAGRGRPAGWQEAARLKVARIGDNMRHVAVTEGDKIEAQLRLGFSVDGYGSAISSTRWTACPTRPVADLLADYEQRYDVAAELRHDGARRDSLVEAARIEAGLREFLTRGGYRAFTDTFEDLHGVRQLPGIAVQRLMADGYGFGGEGDWKTAALVRILKLMATGLPGGTSFMEDYTYDLEGDEPLVLGSHSSRSARRSRSGARAPRSTHCRSAARRTRCGSCSTPRPAGDRRRAARLGDRFRLLVNEVEAISPPQALPKLPVARAIWKPKPDFPTAAEAWLAAGGPHHTVFSAALDSEVLVDFAEIAGVELLMIDGDTRMRDFRNELRWNQAYYRLAQGF